ncbi:MAG: hypothetical protein ACE5JL_14000 [Dehalococcoidia bacterium]
MAHLGKGKLSWKVAAIAGVFALLLGIGVAAILYRSPDIEQDQTVFPLALSVSPNPFPGVGLVANGIGNFTFELTVTSANQNPNLTLTVFVEPSAATNLTVSHCLENSQLNLSAFNNECKDDDFQQGDGEYFANVTSGGSVMLRVQALFVGTINEPTSITWHFHAEGTEIP